MKRPEKKGRSSRDNIDLLLNTNEEIIGKYGSNSTVVKKKIGKVDKSVPTGFLE